MRVEKEGARTVLGSFGLVLNQIATRMYNCLAQPSL
jgi:hypothetical protein